MSSLPRHRRLIATENYLVFTPAFAGCTGTDTANVVHVQGAVTYNGQPLPLGMIVFEPDPSKGNSGPQGHADIKNG